MGSKQQRLDVVVAFFCGGGAACLSVRKTNARLTPGSTTVGTARVSIFINNTSVTNTVML